MKLKQFRFKACAERPNPKAGCYCDLCCERRRTYWRIRRQESRLKSPLERSIFRQGFRSDLMRRHRAKPQRFRCHDCGWLQQIPEGETARCQRCGEVPLFARPEPDLRQFRHGR